MTGGIILVQGGKNKKTAVVSMEPSPEEEVKPKKEPKKRRREPEDNSHKSKSKFQEYLEMEMGGAAVGREEDLEMERKLAKKLRVKKGKLGGPDDGMDDLFADLGFCGDYGSDGETEDTKPEKKKRKRKNKNLKDDAMEEGSGKVVDDSKVDKKKKKRKNKKVKDDASEEPGGGGVEMAEESDVSVHESEDEVLNAVETPPVSKAKYVPPSLRAISSSESEEISLLRRRVRGVTSNSVFYFRFYATHF